MKEVVQLSMLALLAGCSAGGSSDRVPTVTETPAGVVLERGSVLRWDLDVGDLDRDGRLEVVVAETALDGGPPPHPGSMTVFRQTAPRQFARGVTYETPPESHSVSIADMDADGFPDVLVGSHVSEPGVTVDRLTLFRHSGSGVELLAAGSIELPILLQDFAMADLDGDGLPEVAAAGWPQSLILRNDPDSPGSLHVAQIIDRTASSLALADLDGDGRIDLILNRGSVAASLSIYLQEDEWFAFWGDLDTADPREVRITDFDGDGLADIMVTSGVSPGGAPWPTVSLFVQLQDPGVRLAFRPPVSYVADRSAAGWRSALAVADLDGDERIDVAMIASHANRQRRNGIYNYIELRSNIAVLHQAEDGALGSAALHLIPEGVWDLAAADLESDGYADIVLSTSRSVTVLFNDDRSPGTFGAPVTIDE